MEAEKEKCEREGSRVQIGSKVQKRKAERQGIGK
jgi:hypothetical protein